ncbi:hypothetical protein NOGI109294_27265 [Nocardiopsis gilva]
MQAEVGALGDELGQRGQGVALAVADQVEVVDHDEQFQPLPPAAFPELLRGDVGAGQALLDRTGQLAGDLLGELRLGAVGEQVLLADHAEVGALEVDQDDAHLLRRALGELPQEAAQQGALARLRVAEDHQVRLLGQLQQGRFQGPLRHSEHQFRAVVRPRQLVQLDQVRQRPHLLHGPRGPALGDLGDEVAHALAQVLVVGDAVDPRQGDVGHVLVGEKRPPRDVLGDLLGDLAADARVERVGQPQLDPAAEEGRQLAADLRARRTREDRVHAQRRAAGDDVEQHVVGVLEVLPDRRPPVDHQEHVTGDALGHLPLGAGLAQPGRGVQAHAPEHLLALVELGGHVGEDALHPLGVGPAGHARHVRKPLQGRQTATAEVDRVDRHAAGRVPPRQTGDHRAQQGALAGLRPAEHHDVAVAAGEVHRRRFLPLVARDVGEADVGAHLGGVRFGLLLVGRAAVLSGDLLEERVQGECRRQRGQPHRAHRLRSGRDQAVHGDLQDAAGR